MDGAVDELEDWGGGEVRRGVVRVKDQPRGMRNLLQRRLADVKQRGKGVELDPVGGGRRGVVALPRAEVLILQRRVLVALDAGGAVELLPPSGEGDVGPGEQAAEHGAAGPR